MIPASFLPAPVAGSQGPQSKGSGSSSSEPGKGFGALVHGGAKGSAKDAPAKDAHASARSAGHDGGLQAGGETAAGEENAAETLAALTQTGECADEVAADELGNPDGTGSKADDETNASNVFAFSPLMLMERRMPHDLGRGANTGDPITGNDGTGANGDGVLPGEAGAPLKAEAIEAKPASGPLDTISAASADAAASALQAAPSNAAKLKSPASSSAVAEAVRALGLPSAAGAGVAPAQGGTSSQLSWDRGSDGGASGGRSSMRNAEAAIGLWGSKLAEDASVQGASADAEALSSSLPSVSATPAALASALAKPAESVQMAASTQPLLAHALDHAATQGQRTLKLQLHPTELGSVTAKLRVTGGGLAVELQVETDAAREKLGADNGEAIRAALSALGLQIDSVSVQSAPNGSAAQAGADSGSGGNSNANRQAGFAAESGEGRGNGRGAGGNAEGQEQGGQSERLGGARADGVGRAQSGVFI